MEGAVDLKLIITLLGVAASIFGGAAVAKMRIKDLQESISEIHATLKNNDRRIDVLENQTSITNQRLDILGKMNAPDVLEKRHRETAKLLSDVENALDRVKHLETMHNTIHPPVPSERVGK